jgi:hypothetical protein
MVSPVELTIEFLLEFDTFGSILLNKIGCGERFRKIGRELQVRPRSSGREAQSLQRRPRILHELPERRFCGRCDVGRDDLQSSGEKQRGPACADHTGANDGDMLNGFCCGHDISLCLSDLGMQGRLL